MVSAFRRTYTVDAAIPSVVRQELRSWLDERGWPVAEAEEVVLAMSEAVTNVVEHAYRHIDASRYGQVEITAHLRSNPDRSRRVIIDVRDHGRWRAVPRDPGNRGRGLAIIRACTDRLDITHGPSGTAVRMVSRPVSFVPIGQVARVKR